MRVRLGQKLVSIVSDGDGEWMESLNAPPGGTVRYRVGRWTRPRKGCGPLCLFTSSSPFQGPRFTYWAEYRPSRATRVWVRVRGRLKEVRHLRDLSDDTALATAIKLLPQKE